MHERYTPKHDYARLRAETIRTLRIRPGWEFHQFPYIIPGTEHQLVNVYLLKIARTAPIRFGMMFADHGDYCLDFARRIRSTTKSNSVAAINCNFGFVATDTQHQPVDVSYNLRIEGGVVKQLPVADKTVCMLRSGEHPRFTFRRARGCMTVSGVRLNWVGSLSRHADPSQQDVRVYSAFNCTLVQHIDKHNNSIKRVDESSLRATKGADVLFVPVDLLGDRLACSSAPNRTPPSLLSTRLVLQIPTHLRHLFGTGTRLERLTLDGLRLSAVEYASSVGAILTRDPEETACNIEQSQLLRTTTNSGTPAYGGHRRFARACLLESPNATIFLLVDARAKVPFQNGVSIPELQELLKHSCPEFTGAVNVDGGHAPKLVIFRHGRFHLYGNLHYQLWPRTPNGDFQWDGIRGRKVPGVIYCKD